MKHHKDEVPLPTCLCWLHFCDGSYQLAPQGVHSGKSAIDLPAGVCNGVTAACGEKRAGTAEGCQSTIWKGKFNPGEVCHQAFNIPQTMASFNLGHTCTLDFTWSKGKNSSAAPLLAAGCLPKIWRAMFQPVLSLSFTRSVDKSCNWYTGIALRNSKGPEKFKR